MNLKKITSLLLLILWMGMIFLFSNQNGTASKSLSDKVASGVIEGIGGISKNPPTEKAKNEFIKSTRVIIRKGAHFTAYFILGILVYFALSSFSVKNTWQIAIGVCFLFACSDELHQLFLDGRTAKIIDVGIDTLGASGAIYLTNKFYQKRKSL